MRLHPVKQNNEQCNQSVKLQFHVHDALLKVALLSANMIPHTIELLFFPFALAVVLFFLQAIHDERCNGHTEGVGSFDVDSNCKKYLTGWILLFAAIQLLLSQVKDFHSLW